MALAPAAHETGCEIGSRGLFSQATSHLSILLCDLPEVLRFDTLPKSGQGGEYDDND